MKKILCSLAVLTLVLGISVSAHAAKEMWKFSTFFDEDHALTKGAIKFKEEIEKKHGDKIEIKIFTLNQLGEGREILEGLQLGTIELAEAGTPYAASFSDAFFPLNMPYLFLTRPIAWELLDGPFGTRMAKRFEDQADILLLGYWENGIRHATSNRQQIKSPEDVKNLKIRVQADPIHIAIWRALGAQPTPMTFGEVFTALQQGVIDGQENPVANIVQRKFHEVQKYLSKTAHVYDVTGFYMNRELFEKQSLEMQKDILEAAAAATKHQREESITQDDRYFKRVEEFGKIAIYQPTTEELQVFKKNVEPVYKEVEAMIAAKDKEFAKIVPELLEEISKVEKKHLGK